MSAPKEILRLVDKFKQHLDSYKSGQYNEAQLRSEFLDPFFKALGWDMDNTQGLAEAYKDVVHEDAIRIGGAVKAPDYCFRIGGTRKFFLEAKKPSVAISEETPAAYQLRRYAWSAKLPLSILSDFEEFAVYDCRIKPNKTDSAATARVFLCRFEDFPEKWEWISSIFSKDAVLKGSFDKYAEENKAKRGTAQVDDDFLATIEHWRSELAKNLALRNSRLSQRELNFAVQRIIDRVIFLRICEDRGIELYGRLQGLTNGPNIYRLLCEVFEDADAKYNSGLFHFKAEKGRHELPDEITLSLEVDDKLLRDLFRGLYYPESPYEFTVFSSDILGQVYEQFLGKVIRLTEGHRAVVEDKPEVKKAGGVYYTPIYIVDYIVKQTVGKLVEEKNPKHVAKLRILDPACGSGSFLINAYQFLLDWHHDWYLAHNPESWTKGRNPVLVQTTAGWKLTITERKRILLNNIYGVDIDPQAVEVTKLSLLLKVLEGESEQTIQPYLRLFQQRALPDLGDNIKCGNSLIGPDFFIGKDIRCLSDRERIKINPFDWDDEFGITVFKGGFDAVIGNPPYIGFHGFVQEKEYLKQHYRSACGKFDIYLPFIERSLALMKTSGLLGFICPTNFLKRDHGLQLRAQISSSASIREICDFEDVQIFKGALNYTGIFIFQKEHPSPKHQFSYRKRSLDATPIGVNQSRLSSEPWIIRDAIIESVVNKIKSSLCTPLSEMADAIMEGIVTGQNDVFLLDRAAVRKYGIEAEIIRPHIRGREIRQYWIEQIQEAVIYPYKLKSGKTVPLSERELEEYPKLWSYLRSRRGDLSGRGYFEKSAKQWYELWCPRDMSMLSREKIVVPELAEANRFALARGSQFLGDTACAIILKTSIKEDIYFMLGLLNSRLLEYFYKATTVPKANHYYIYKTMFLRNLPIRRIAFNDSEETGVYRHICLDVKSIMDLDSRLQKERTTSGKELIHRQIKALDKEINLAVFKLYRLSEQEARMIELAGNMKGIT